MNTKIFTLIAILFTAVITYLLIVPAFQGRLLISPVVHVGPLELRWYGLILAAAVLAGYLISRRLAWRFGIDKREIDDFAFWLILVSVIGARLYFVLFNLDFYLANPHEIYQVWHGGISIYGALLAGMLFIYLWGRNKAYSFRSLLDVVALGLPLAQALGRWGNFINYEAFGLPTSLPWGMFVPQEHRPYGFSEYEFFHPAFLYESILLVGLFFLLKHYAGRLNPGVLTAIYLASYSLIRFFVEPLRLDNFWLGDIRANQLMALIVFLIAGAAFIKWQLMGKKTDLG